MKQYTVFFCDKGEDVVINSLEYFLDKGKTYEEIQKRLKENLDFIEKQDKVLWTITRKYERQKVKIDKCEKIIEQIDEILINWNME